MWLHGVEPPAPCPDADRPMIALCLLYVRPGSLNLELPKFKLFEAVTAAWCSRVFGLIYRTT
jgi:hypothetical protein